MSERRFQVRRSRWARGSRVAVLTGSLALLLTGCSANDWERNLRFGWPTGVTKQAESMRVLWTWSGVAALIVGAGVWGLIFWSCIKHRKKSDELPRQTKYNLPLEIVYSIIPFVIIAGLFYRTVVVEDRVNALSKNPDVLVKVDAFKWNWQFEYLGVKSASNTGLMTPQVYPGRENLADAGKFVDQPGCVEASSNVSFSCGVPDLLKVDESTNPLYLNTVGSDNEIPILVIPVGQKVRIVEHSEDVIHSFWVPEFLFKRDVIPFGTSSTARDNQFEFTATSTGSFVGRCAELCGTYHSQMNFEVRVVEPSVFTDYLAALQKIGPDDPARQAKALVEANVPGGAEATTTYPFNTDRTAKSASEN